MADGQDVAGVPPLEERLRVSDGGVGIQATGVEVDGGVRDDFVVGHVGQ